MGLEGLSFGDGGAALGIELAKIPEDGRVHAAEAQFFFDQRQMIAYEG